MLGGRRTLEPPPAKRTELPAEQEETRSPLTDSNRRPPLYEEGPCVKSSVVGIAQLGRVPRWWVASGAHLSIASSRGRTWPMGVRSGGASPLGTVRRPGGRWRLGSEGLVAGEHVPDRFAEPTREI